MSAADYKSPSALLILIISVWCTECGPARDREPVLLATELLPAGASARPAQELCRRGQGPRPALRRFVAWPPTTLPLPRKVVQPSDRRRLLLPFSTADGSAYVLGKLNGEHWYLYMTEKPEKKYGRGPLLAVDWFLVSWGLTNHFCFKIREGLAPDATLEILMSDLDQEAMKPFYKQHSTDSRAASVVRTTHTHSAHDMTHTTHGHSRLGGCRTRASPTCSRRRSWTTSCSIRWATA